MDQSASPEEKILLATIECIENYGIRGATNRRIAAVANVNVAAINYYFRNKEILVQRVMAMTLENAFRYEDFADLPGSSAQERCLAIFDHLLGGGCRYPGLTRAHFSDLLINGNYESLVVASINEFVDNLSSDLATRGCSLSTDELRLACTQITSAAMFVILAPRIYEVRFGLNACDETMRRRYLGRLIEKLL